MARPPSEPWPTRARPRERVAPHSRAIRQYGGRSRHFGMEDRPLCRVLEYPGSVDDDLRAFLVRGGNRELVTTHERIAVEVVHHGVDVGADHSPVQAGEPRMR